LAKLDRMRIFVDVPQSDSGYVHVGQTCSVRIRELCNRDFAATVTRLADSIDIASRTMRTEVHLTQKVSSCLIPANTLVPSPSGDQVVVLRDGVAHFQNIAVTTDYGAQVEVGDGVKLGDTLVENVTDAIREGAKVQIASKGGR
jgi:Barrel-sandwich domain of CusB or HlyD membrane-fusion